ncbi:MAG TPA: M4 family metallopeptidase [Solirubrobacterales bacterium]
MIGKLRTGLLVGALALAIAAPARASDTPAGLARQLGPGTRVAAQSEVGAGITFIGTAPGKSIPLRAATPRAAALEAGARFGDRFGLGPDGALHVADVEPVRDGSFAARLRQTIDGVPVLGGELAVGLDPAGDLLSIGGELEPAMGIDTTPTVAAAAATETAIAAVAKDRGVAAASLSATTPELAIYDPRILGGPGLFLPRPVWRLEVSSDSSPVTVRNLVLVDAGLGNVALSFSEIDAAGKSRIVCNAESEPKLVPCLAPEAELVEGDDPTAAALEAGTAYELTGDLYDFYADHFGRDSIDGMGMPLVSTVDYCEPEECPFENAFWNGEQMVYGEGMVTDDITGHELTHGVDASESNLFYYYQSGALDEALADIFGELFDLSLPTYSGHVDTPEDRWLIGEDSALGPIRDLSDPPSHGQPDRTGDTEDWAFNPDTDFEKGDNGGVHTNSGVGGKAAFLMTDGGSFNGQTVTGLGEEKTLQITYDVSTNMLTSASDYQDYGNDLRQACSDLVGEYEITAGDCEQVEKTVLATEMEKPPAAAAPPTASLCGPAGTPVPAFFDGFESPPPNGNWTLQPSPEASVFFFSQETAELGFDATYAKSGSGNIWGFDAGEITDSAIAMTKSVTVPGGGRMHFDHAHGFETGEGNDYDGGVIEYSTDGGLSWKDAGGLIEAGDEYGGTIFKGAGSPLAGRRAFVGDSAGYGSTRLNLSSLAGKQVRFRFRIGTDEAQEDYGWFIDNVEIYHCEGEEEPPPPPTESPSATPSATPGTPEPVPPVTDRCATTRAALVRARAKAASLRRRLRSTQPPTAKARKAVRRATADVRKKRAAARRACVH